MASHEHVSDDCPPRWKLLLAETRELPTSDEQRTIDEHLAGCAMCRSYLRTFHATVDEYRELGLHKTPNPG